MKVTHTTPTVSHIDLCLLDQHQRQIGVEVSRWETNSEGDITFGAVVHATRFNGVEHVRFGAYPGSKKFRTKVEREAWITLRIAGTRVRYAKKFQAVQP